MKAEAATAREPAAPLAAQIKELTLVASEWDTFRYWAKEAMTSAKAITG